MKLIIIFASLNLFSCIFAQEKIDPRFKWFDTDKNHYVEYKKDIANIRDILRKDSTDEVKYQLAKFSCHNFAKKLYIQNSSLVKDLAPYNIDELEKEWSTKIEINNEQKLDLYYVTMQSSEDGFFHAINAVLLNKNEPQNLSSYVFIEPQNDQLYLAYELKRFSERSFAKKFKGDIKIDIRTFDGLRYTGSIWQSMSTAKYSGIILN